MMSLGAEVGRRSSQPPGVPPGDLLNHATGQSEPAMAHYHASAAPDGQHQAHPASHTAARSNHLRVQSAVQAVVADHAVVAPNSHHHDHVSLTPP
eukprot:7383465-Prymnesium_polylepis.2